jgi:putative membrane protein
MIANVLVGAIALFHVWVLVLEMFLWTKPIGLRTFGRTQAEADSSKVLAANQGLYNGFLAAGLIWSLVAHDPAHAHTLKLFFLGCVFVAGIYGGLTASKKIIFVQALPAGIALAFVFAASF